jgi:hypothetical protein
VLPLLLWKSSITYSECVSVASFIQYVKHMRRILLSYVFWLTLPYFSPLSRKRHDFWEKLLNIRMCILTLQPLSETFLILRRSERDTVINVSRS